ncbi:Glycosyltransferase involved in cell wall bisynthesis [Prevotella sp. tc2-28]|uniref:glycosyltransferase family 4 protein n=1 Tax=Prevotella sp. tc2-28 TaxID=1761888 RepID=UPI00089C758A|nr:glycosyltransferase family 4 protein [Prevotella sp. tc2-28]SEA82165.1 Glycosyltransferase involved in cell wall bisynthesis [Prevotella sp. tc2-28]
MKIAILTSGILPIPAVQGGAVENLTDFYLEYNNQHRLHDITIYSVWHPDVERHPALQSTVNHYVYIKVTGLWAKLKKKWHQLTRHEEYYHYTIEFYLQEAIKDISRRSYDIILIENRPAYALKLKEVSNAKLVYHLHNEKLDSKSEKALDIYNAATCIITVSDYIKSRVLTINHYDKKTTTVYNGIDLHAFSSCNHSINRNSIGLQEDDFVMVFSGRVTAEKGIMQLIEAMTLLQDLPRIKLLVIGSSFYGNDDNENSFAKALREKAAHLSDRIIFTGFIPYAQMPNYLQIADIAVIPSVWDDPFPTTVLEALATGLPIISTRRGGIPEQVTEESAILLDTDEYFVDNLATAIRNLYQHPEKRKALGQAGLLHSKYFDKERFAKDFFKAIQTI